MYGHVRPNIDVRSSPTHGCTKSATICLRSYFSGTHSALRNIRVNFLSDLHSSMHLHINYLILHSRYRIYQNRTRGFYIFFWVFFCCVLYIRVRAILFIVTLYKWPSTILCNRMGLFSQIMPCFFLYSTTHSDLL